MSPWLCRVLMVGGSGVIVGLKCYILYGVTPAANDEWNVGMAKITDRDDTRVGDEHLVTTTRFGMNTIVLTDWFRRWRQC